MMDNNRREVLTVGHIHRGHTILIYSSLFGQDYRYIVRSPDNCYTVAPGFGSGRQALAAAKEYIDIEYKEVVR